MKKAYDSVSHTFEPFNSIRMVSENSHRSVWGDFLSWHVVWLCCAAESRAVVQRIWGLIVSAGWEGESSRANKTVFHGDTNCTKLKYKHSIFNFCCVVSAAQLNEYCCLRACVSECPKPCNAGVKTLITPRPIFTKFCGRHLESREHITKQVAKWYGYIQSFEICLWIA